jgi:hypothetical protein
LIWFRRADADHLLQKARWFRSIAIDDDDTPISDRLLEMAADLEAHAAEIEAGGFKEALWSRPSRGSTRILLR